MTSTSRLIQLVNVAWSCVNMENGVISLAVPFIRCIFYNIIAYCDHQICLFNSNILVVFLWNTDSP